MTPHDSRRLSAEPERGFTLIELLVVMATATIAMTLGAFAVRHYWMVQSLQGARGEILSQMRQRQVQAVSESHPLVFGVRVLPGSSIWGVVQYRPDDISTTGIDESSCTETQTHIFATNVRVEAATVGSSPEATYCQSNLKYLSAADVPDRLTSQYIMFYPRGTATSATLSLLSPTLNRSLGVTVTPITGKAEAS